MTMKTAALYTVHRYGSVGSSHTRSRPENQLDLHLNFQASSSGQAHGVGVQPAATQAAMQTPKAVLPELRVSQPVRAWAKLI